MESITVKEKNAVFKAATEQLKARMLAAGVKKPTRGLVDQTFRKLDIEAIAPKYFMKLNKEADAIRLDHKSKNITKRVNARKKLRANKDLRTWKSSKAAGIKIESDKLMAAFKTVKGVY